MKRRKKCVFHPQILQLQVLIRTIEFAVHQKQDIAKRKHQPKAQIHKGKDVVIRCLDSQPHQESFHGFLFIHWSLTCCLQNGNVLVISTRKFPITKLAHLSLISLWLQKKSLQQRPRWPCLLFFQQKQRWKVHDFVPGLFLGSWSQKCHLFHPKSEKLTWRSIASTKQSKIWQNIMGPELSRDVFFPFWLFPISCSVRFPCYLFTAFWSWNLPFQRYSLCNILEFEHLIFHGICNNLGARTVYVAYYFAAFWSLGLI